MSFFAPGYIEQVWNLPALSGVLPGGIPLEELAFGFAFGLYWAGIYEHFTWHRGQSNKEADMRYRLCTCMIALYHNATTTSAATAAIIYKQGDCHV
jgi:hypothetical protein